MVGKIPGVKVYLNERDHNPPHVHAKGKGAEIRINLLTLEVMDDRTDFDVATVRRIIQYVREHRDDYLTEWSKIYGERD